MDLCLSTTSMLSLRGGGSFILVYFYLEIISKMDDCKEERSYWHVTEETLDRNIWRTGLEGAMNRAR